MTEQAVQTEPVTQEQVSAIIKMLGMGAMLMDWGKVDYQIGRGVLEGDDRCLWTTDGHRITINLIRGGGITASQSREIDPTYQTLKLLQAW